MSGESARNHGARLPRMMLGFVVRRCAVALGRSPSAAEFAAWANDHGTDGERYCLFGRPISEDEARLILAHPGRLVTAKSARAEEEHREDEWGRPVDALGNVVSLAEIRARLARTTRPGTRRRS
jgi:hypothetical protein